jgi:hypothetical protein
MINIQRRIDLLKLLPKNPVVAEIGVAEGNFSRDLLEAGVYKLYSIDYWTHIPSVTGDGNFPQQWHDENYEAAKKLLAPYGDRSIILRGLSKMMAERIQPQSLDMVYLDGAHYYDGVVADLYAYINKVKRGGIVAGHDYLSPDYGVKEAVDRFVKMMGDATGSEVKVHVIPEATTADAGFYFTKTW